MQSNDRLRNCLMRGFGTRRTNVSDEPALNTIKARHLSVMNAVRLTVFGKSRNGEMVRTIVIDEGFVELFCQLGDCLRALGSAPRERRGSGTFLITVLIELEDAAEGIPGCRLAPFCRQT